jgi:hypothetical protein
MSEQKVTYSTTTLKVLCEQVDKEMKQPPPVVYTFGGGRREFRDKPNPYQN